MNKKIYYPLRILQIVSLVIIASFITYQFSMLKNTANEIKYQQTEKFAYSLTNLAAAQATRYLTSKKSNELQQLVDDLSDDPIIRDVTIYDDLGKILHQSANVLPLVTLLNIERDSEVENQGVIPYISELNNEGKKIGYIRISLEQEKILSLINFYQSKSSSTMLILLVLSFVAGCILMAFFFRRLENAYYQMAKELNQLMQQNRMYW